MKFVLQGLTIIIMVFLLASLSFAQQPGPGFPNVDYPTSRVGEMISASQGFFDPQYAALVPQSTRDSFGALPPGVFGVMGGRAALVGFHRGYVVIGSEAPGSEGWSQPYLGQRFYDISNPGQPRLAREVMTRRLHSGSAHGYGKIGDQLYLGQHYRISDDNRILIVDDNTPSEFGDGARGGLFANWAARVLWSYDDPEDRQRSAYLRERSPANEDNWTVHANVSLYQDTGMVGHPIILGNLLIYASEQSDSGVAIYDISNPRAPVLLDHMNIDRGVGAYWPEVWKHYLIFPRRTQAINRPPQERDVIPQDDWRGRVQVVDFRDPTNIRFVHEMPVKGNPMYIQFQDNFAFTERSKIDLSALNTYDPDRDSRQDWNNPQPDVNFLPIALELNESRYSLDTSQYALPIGNMLVTGGHDSGEGQRWQGSGLWIHQAQADRTGPTVGYHMPRHNEPNYSVEMPVMILIHETIETSNIINGQTFIVRDVASGHRLNGFVVHAHNDILSFNPHSNPWGDNFQAGRTYEVILRQDMITDAAGNALQDQSGPGDTIDGIPIAYRFTFTTATTDNALPSIGSLTSNIGTTVGAGSRVTFTLSASDDSNIEYRINYGDGSLANKNRTAWTQANSNTINVPLSNVYNTIGTYTVKADVRETGSLTRLSSRTLTLTVNNGPPTGNDLLNAPRNLIVR